MQTKPGYANGPAFWTIENAAAAIQRQEEWTDAAGSALFEQMLSAAQGKELKARHPDTEIPDKPRDLLGFADLVTPDDVNAWLERCAVSYRWNTAADATRKGPLNRPASGDALDDEVKTTADRVERALKEHEARKKAAAELAAQQASELERLKALHAQLEALPQSERRAVLGAAGMRQVSAAPKPIEPLRGSSYVPRPSGKAIRWPAWLALPHVELWQAVALSLGVNPADDLRKEVSRAPSRFSRLPAEFFERLSHCQQALSSSGPIRPQGGRYEGMLQSPACPVLMADVAAFLTLAEFELPEELSEGLPPSAAQGAQPLQRWVFQEQEILRVLRELGFEPRTLPKPAPGTPGPKAAARTALGSTGIWTGERVFEKAWERLRASEQIADKS